MSARMAQDDDPIHIQTQHVAAKIESQVSGVRVKGHTNLESFKLVYDEYLPPEVGEIAREHGYALDCIYGTAVQFRRQ